MYVSILCFATARCLFLSWEAQYQIPPWLLESLCEAQPKCQLWIKLPYSSNTAQALANIRAYSQLRALDIVGANCQHQAFAELGHLLMHAKSLTSFSIHCAIDDAFSEIPGRSARHGLLASSTYSISYHHYSFLILELPNYRDSIS